MNKKRLIALILITSIATSSIFTNSKIAHASTLSETSSSKSENLNFKKIPTKGVVVNVSTSLRVRQSPSTSGKILGHLKNGDSFNILGKSGSWYKIKFKNSTGYIHSEFVKVTNFSNNSSNESSLNKTGQVINISTALRVRSGASTSSSTIGSLKNGTKVTIVAKQGNWYKIKFNSKYGYVSSNYIKILSNGSSSGGSSNGGSSNGEVSYIKNGQVINITSSLSVRSGAGTNFSRIGYLKNGAKLNVVAKKGDWYKIKFNSKYGYVNSKYIKILSDNSSSGGSSNGETSYVKNGQVINITSSLSVRNGAGTNFKRIGSLKNGAKVNIVAKKSGWYKIKFNSGYGYISADYIKILENVNPPIKPPVGEPTTSNTVYTKYPMTMKTYIEKQHEKTPSHSIARLTSYINPNVATNNYQFLRIDKFREVNQTTLNNYLNEKKAGVLQGHASSFIKAAKAKNIDPIYFTAQSIHETGYGSSTLAKGVKITQIANTNKEIKNSKGELIGYEMIKLSKPVTVYNLFGIGARDNSAAFPNRALILGTTYAYNKGWTSVPKAIDGAAEFVSINYIHSSKYEQNTLYKMKFNPKAQYMWHQYATSPWYAESIGNQMKEMSKAYKDKSTFNFDKPQFK